MQISVLQFVSGGYFARMQQPGLLSTCAFSSGTPHGISTDSCRILLCFFPFPCIHIHCVSISILMLWCKLCFRGSVRGC